MKNLSKFRKGQKLICINEHKNTYVSIGEEVEMIKAVDPSEDFNILVKNKNGLNQYAFDGNFKLI